MASCQTPFTIRDKMTGQSKACPCGKCPNCFARRTSSWSFRLMQEEKCSASALFVTFTYDEHNLPFTKSGYMTLDKADIPRFFKRLRKLDPAAPIKYFAVGEYGTNYLRPHYHAIIFNATQDDILKAWALDGKTLGSVHFGGVTGASVGYTLKYMSKKSRIPMHKNDDRQPEFALMSKGLGSGYLTPAMIAWHTKAVQSRMYCVIEGGKKISMPRYYKDRVYSDEQRKAAGVAARLDALKALDKAEAANPDHYRDKFQSDLNAFQSMERDSSNYQTL